MGIPAWGSERGSTAVDDGTFKTSELPKGWECPKCGSVWSPKIYQCFNCSGGSDIKITITEIEKG